MERCEFASRSSGSCFPAHHDPWSCYLTLYFMRLDPPKAARGHRPGFWSRESWLDFPLAPSPDGPDAEWASGKALHTSGIYGSYRTSNVFVAGRLVCRAWLSARHPRGTTSFAVASPAALFISKPGFRPSDHDAVWTTSLPPSLPRHGRATRTVQTAAR